MYKAYDSSDWPTMLPEVNAIMNNRKNAALEYVRPLTFRTPSNTTTRNY